MNSWIRRILLGWALVMVAVIARPMSLHAATWLPYSSMTPRVTNFQIAALAESFISTTIATLPRGSGANQLGILDALSGEVPTGPTSLKVLDNRKVFVLDSVNYRVLVLSANGVPQSDIAFDNSAWGIDLTIDANEELYILDGRENRLLIYRAHQVNALERFQVNAASPHHRPNIFAAFGLVTAIHTGRQRDNLWRGATDQVQFPAGDQEQVEAD